MNESVTTQIGESLSQRPPRTVRTTLGSVVRRMANRGDRASQRVPLEMLPPRYRDGHAVTSTPMGDPAGLVYDSQGRVAWDRIWSDFCDLALAGGPPHRSSLLRAPRRIASKDVEKQSLVLDELHRALDMVTGWPRCRAVPTGWIGLSTPDATAAAWMALAIRAENVDVRADEHVLLLPAGPDFQLTGEIKNVVTAVAKAHHYWLEHDGILD